MSITLGFISINVVLVVRRMGFTYCLLDDVNGLTVYTIILIQQKVKIKYIIT